MIDEFVAGNTQNKLEMMVVPRQYPFQLYSLRISYTWKRNPSESILLFPNTMLKLAVYLPIQKYEFVDSWRSCAKIYKTDTFKLSKDFPPNTLSTSCIKQLIELTSYEAFKEEGSTMDYELACNMLLE